MSKNNIADIEKSYHVTGDFSIFGNIILVDAGIGVGVINPIVLVEKNIPYGNRIELKKIFFRIIDDVIRAQMQFSLKHNGSYVYPWYKINGELVDRMSSIDINQIFESGLLSLVAHNISGTTEAGASAESYDDIRCQGAWIANLLSYDRSLIWEN